MKYEMEVEPGERWHANISVWNDVANVEITTGDPSHAPALRFILRRNDFWAPVASDVGATDLIGFTVAKIQAGIIDVEALEIQVDKHTPQWRGPMYHSSEKS
jgi:hypothetical protein